MIPLGKNIKRYFSLKEFAVVFLAVVISISAGVAVFNSLKREVTIDDNGKLITLKTMKTTVKEVLDQVTIAVSPDDYINLPLDSKLQKIKKNEIYIKRAVPVNILVDGQELKLMTYRDSVQEALAHSPVKMDEQDKLDGVILEDPIQKDMKIRIVRVKEEEQNEQIAIPYNVVSRENNHLDLGVEKTIRDGTEGTREKTFKVVLEDGKEVLRELIKETIVANPIDKIIEFGTVLNHRTARGDTIRYKKVLDMTSTSYTSSYRDTGKNPGDPGFGITSTGMVARKGVVAVDPKVIPLGSRLYIEVAGNTPDYGFAIAADTGGAVKGNIIDLYFEDPQQAYSWGLKRVKVYMLID